jgi:3-hydroxyisobutyrate dehydrogenase-like beta-hydroxyacid dehydrogenase
VRLGVVGLGLVGRALARRAVAAGLEVAGVDTAPVARVIAREQGIPVIDDMGALRPEALLVTVFDGAQLRDVVERVLAAPPRPTIILHAVTAEPALSAELAGRCAALSVAFVEFPLSGSSAQIAAGEALALVGATDDAWARAAALIAQLAPEHVHVGGPGAGARAKLATNLILGLNRTALAEGLLLAEKLGFDGARFLDLLRRSSAYSRAVDVAGPRMVAGDFSPVSRLAQHRKDLVLILEEAAKAGLDLPLAKAHEALLAEGEAQGKGDLDNVAVIAVLRARGDHGGSSD